MMDNSKYEVIQKVMIDALDKGDYVHIKGCSGNETDIIVKLHEIKNPEKETNFVNRVAEVNIPLGEVYTSPTLKGTNGVLHLKDTYLGLKYKNLKLHDRLPLGEFAIGTNTTAYVMAQKYGIIEVLPVLIIEKMGPHFAIGDTCFGWAEDLPVHNLVDNKEVIARENEHSALRKEDINKAYTGVHTDITIPYEEIEFVKVVNKDGESVDIIRNGRFALEGTEELNRAFVK
jgi:leucyl aminopeptidase (aminopeptidase T)